MTRKEIDEFYNNACNLISKKQIKDVFSIINTMISKNPNADHSYQLNMNIETYQNFLKYKIGGFQDPDEDKIYRKLIVSTLKLVDVVKHYALYSESSLNLYNDKRKYDNSALFTKDEAKKIIEEFTLEIELNDLLQQVDISTDAENNHQQRLNEIFNRIWLANKFVDADIELLRTIINEPAIPWHDKSLIVTALILSLITCFDTEKFYLLLEFVDKREHQIWQRALVGVVVGIFLYQNRLKFYPELVKVVSKKFSELDHSIVRNILIQLLKTKDTEKYAKKFENEIIPEIVKNAPKIHEKLDIENLLSENFDEDKNPDWQKVFEESEHLYAKIEEFSEMQMDGTDIFMSAFSRLKHFSFFNNLHNWFVPFFSTNKNLIIHLKDSKSNVNQELIKALESNTFLCNSDKYSFILNIQNIPEAQRNMMKNLFIQESEQLKELSKEDKILDKSDQSKIIATQFIQDLYRFFKVYPYKNQFEDVFKLDFNIGSIQSSGIIEFDYETLWQIAEYYFKNEHFDNSIKVYFQLEQANRDNIEVLQKIAFCYQKQRDFDNALDYYLKAELLDDHNLWNIKKIAYCYKQSEQFEKALGYYLQAEKFEPENLNILANLGQIYIELDKHEDALKHFFKIEYLNPSNPKTLRPIAWCYFKQSKFDDAKKYYLKIPKKEVLHYDLINMGHIEWCENNLQGAIEYYKSSLQDKKLSLQAFIKILIDDKPFLISKGVDYSILPQILDYLRYQIST